MNTRQKPPAVETRVALGLIYERGLLGMPVDQMEADSLKQDARNDLTDTLIDAANQMIMEIKR